MRILMACAAFPPFMDGGGPVSTMMIAKALISAGHEVQVVNVSGEDKQEIYDGVPVRRLKSLNIDWNYRLPRPAWKKLLWHLIENGNPRAFFVMRREMRRFRPDIVLTVSIENINVASWAAARSLGLPVAHMIYSTFLLCWKGSMRKSDQNCAMACGSCRATSLGKRFFSRYVSAVLGETDFIVGRHLEHGYFPNARSYTIPGAIPAVMAQSPRAAVRDRPMVFGFIGLHDKVKGLDTLAAAAHRLKHRPDIRFLIGGSGKSDYASQLPERFPSENTRFLGWTNPAAFFPQVDVGIVPSLFREPFGRVAIEAFSYGVPVIGARSGGIPQSVEEGVTGHLFDPGDDAALAALIERLTDDPDGVARLSANALTAAHSYLPSVMAARFDAVFSDLIGRTDNAGLRDAVWEAPSQ